VEAIEVPSACNQGAAFLQGGWFTVEQGIQRGEGTAVNPGRPGVNEA